MSDAQTYADELRKHADELCAVWQAAERAGHEVEVEFDWRPGLSVTLRSVKCRVARVVVNGIEVNKKEAHEC